MGPYPAAVTAVAQMLAQADRVIETLSEQIALAREARAKVASLLEAAKAGDLERFQRLSRDLDGMRHELKTISGGGVLSREELGRPKLKSEVVEVPEWGGSVVVQELTALQREEIEARVLGPDGKASGRIQGLRQRVVCLTVVDDDGKRLFQDGDEEMLGNHSAAVIDRLASVAQRLSYGNPETTKGN